METSDPKKRILRGSFLAGGLVAHRGLFNAQLPENSLGAFENAARLGMAVELDIHLTKDKKLAVFHDETLLRLTGKNSKISDLNSSELKKIQINNTGFTVPMLDEVLEVVDNNSPLLIEIKSNSSQKVGSLEPILMRQMQKFGNQWAVQSFNPFVLEWFGQNAPQVMRGQLSGNPTVENPTSLKMKYMAFNSISNPDFIAYEYKVLKNEKKARHLVEVATRDKPLLVWGVHNKADYQDCKRNIQADSIIFDGFEV